MTDPNLARAETAIVRCIAEILDNMCLVCVKVAPRAAVILAKAAVELRAEYPDSKDKPS